jgi:hypothetical protein
MLFSFRLLSFYVTWEEWKGRALIKSSFPWRAVLYYGENPGCD